MNELESKLRIAQQIQLAYFRKDVVCDVNLGFALDCIDIVVWGDNQDRPKDVYRANNHTEQGLLDLLDEIEARGHNDNESKNREKIVQKDS